MININKKRVSYSKQSEKLDKLFNCTKRNLINLFLCKQNQKKKM